MRLSWRLIWVACLPVHIWATLVTISIDDTQPDPVTGRAIIYQPAGAWNVGGSCNGCTASPDATQFYNGTWHDGTFNALPGSNKFPNTTLSASATFTGAAVYVICALALTTSGPSGYSDISFFIDQELVGTFARAAPGIPGYEYNVTVYLNSSLTYGTHTITIQNGHVNGPKSLVLLDRIIYMTKTNTTEKPPLGIIVGAAIGAVGGIFFVALAIFLLYRRRKRRDKEFGKTTSHIHPLSTFTNGVPNTSDSSRGGLLLVDSTQSLGHQHPNQHQLIAPDTHDASGHRGMSGPHIGPGLYTIGGSRKTRGERFDVTETPRNVASTATESGSSRSGTRSGRRRSTVLPTTSEAPPAYQPPGF